MQSLIATPRVQSSSPKPAPDQTCYVCGATDALQVAYRFWSTDASGKAIKASKYICTDGRRCCSRIDRAHGVSWVNGRAFINGAAV